MLDGKQYYVNAAGYLRPCDQRITIEMSKDQIGDEQWRVLLGLAKGERYSMPKTESTRKREPTYWMPDEDEGLGKTRSRGFNFSFGWGTDNGLVQDIIFNDPATIVFWTDGSKTVVKCGPHDTYDPEKGFAMCFMKRFFGNGNRFHKLLKVAEKKYPEKVSSEDTAEITEKIEEVIEAQDGLTTTLRNARMAVAKALHDLKKARKALDEKD